MDSLACTACDASFPCPDSMPCLLPREQSADATDAAFGVQWEMRENGRYETETVYGETEAEELRSFLDRFRIQAPEELVGKRILDIGCGSGRLTRSLALYAPDALIVGGDRSAAARLAHRRCRNTPNVGVAQMDLHAAPFAPATFDIVYADGVLPHVPDPEMALADLDALVRPGGQLFVWIYPRRFSPYRLARDLLHGNYARWPRLQGFTEWSLGLPLHATFKLYEPFRGRRRRSLREVRFMLRDNLAPEHQHRRTPEELRRSLEGLGYTDVQESLPETGVGGVKSQA